MLPRVYRPFSLCALLVASLFIAAHPAAAATLDDPATDLHVTLDTPGARVCVVLPVASRNPVGCEDFDVEKGAAVMEKSDKAITGFAMVRFSDWSLLVTLKTNPGILLRSKEDLDSFVSGVKKGSAGVGIAADKISIHNDTSSAPYDIGKLNDLNYLRAHLDLDVSADHPAYDGSRTIVYLFDAKGGSHMLLFTTDPPHAAAAQPIADAIARTVVLPPSHFGSYGEPHAVATAKLLADITLPVVGILVCIALVLRWMWKKRLAAGG